MSTKKDDPTPENPLTSRPRKRRFQEASTASTTAVNSVSPHHFTKSASDNDAPIDNHKEQKEDSDSEVEFLLTILPPSPKKKSNENNNTESLESQSNKSKDKAVIRKTPASTSSTLSSLPNIHQTTVITAKTSLTPKETCKPVAVTATATKKQRIRLIDDDDSDARSVQESPPRLARKVGDAKMPPKQLSYEASTTSTFSFSPSTSSATLKATPSQATTTTKATSRIQRMDDNDDSDVCSMDAGTPASDLPLYASMPCSESTNAPLLTATTASTKSLQRQPTDWPPPDTLLAATTSSSNTTVPFSCRSSAYLQSLAEICHALLWDRRWRILTSGKVTLWGFKASTPFSAK